MRLSLVGLDPTLVTRFEGVAFVKKDQCNVDAVRAALVNAARDVFVQYGESKVPEAPHGHEWLSFGSPAEAAPKPKSKSKPKARPKKEDQRGQQVPQELKGKLSQTCPHDEDAFDVRMEPEKKDESMDKDFVPAPWADWAQSSFFFEQGLQGSLHATITSALRE